VLSWQLFFYQPKCGGGVGKRNDQNEIGRADSDLLVVRTPTYPTASDRRRPLGNFGPRWMAGQGSVKELRDFSATSGWQTLVRTPKFSAIGASLLAP
jgi:hypothetical protein